MRVEVFLGLVMAFGTLVWSYPTSTNLVPSSETMGHGEIRIEISTVSYGGLFRSGTERYAFSQFGWRNLEWGFDIYDYPSENEGYETRWAFNFKVRLWDETDKRPTLSVGILDLGKGLVASPYAVFGKSLGKSTWHWGLGRIGGNERWWVAFEYPINSKLLIVADKLSGKDAFASVGFYWSLNKNLELGIAIGFPNDGQNQRAILLNLAWTR
ncbi:MAG: YjbH domain-containing protein [Armatimonadetes bacterium]|nr:YjbH domain-containing protein [Armatimonadota bacterium]MDW8027777.1 YjbH domain-containing protein [Armatimonadota bacterium]